MVETSNQNLLNSSIIARWIVERQFIWQMKLLSDQELGRKASEKGLSFTASSDDVRRLWQTGLLRADLVVSEQPLEVEGLILIKQNGDEEFIYADQRNSLIKGDGLVGVINQTEELSPKVSLLFHPFRYYVLYHIQRVLEMEVNPTTLLRSADSYRKIAEFQINACQKLSSGEKFKENFRHWNDVVSLAIGAEPFTFSQLFGVYSLPYPYWENEEEFHRAMRDQFNQYKELLGNIGLDKAKEIASELRRHAEYLEPNTDMHLVLRLSERKYRLEKVKGRLGGAVYLLTMAEMIRRAAEEVFETQLPEEDEVGFGTDSADLKEYYYGTQRLLDSHDAKSEFLRDLGLDYSVRLRWYVEGDTELSALRSALEHEPAIEIINLRGNVVAKQGKGLSFRENLLNDMSRSVYSCVYLDGDVVENLRVLRKAVEDGEMFGMFFISEPDFEMANFRPSELVEILWSTATENGAEPDEKQKLIEATSGARTGKEFFNLAKQAVPALRQVDKGKVWGARLMRFARKNPEMQLEDGSKKTRPVIEAIQEALHVADCNYHLSRKECRLDANTGRLVDCKTQQTSDAGPSELSTEAAAG